MKNEDFIITREDVSEITRLTITGRVDSVNAEKFEHKLYEALRDKKTSIVINMSKVDYLCSTGIRVILKAYKDARESGGTLGIENPSESVRKVLVITSLDKTLIL